MEGERTLLRRKFLEKSAKSCCVTMSAYLETGQVAAKFGPVQKSYPASYSIGPFVELRS